MIIIPLSKKITKVPLIKLIQEKLEVAEQICTYDFNILKVENINTQCTKLLHLFKQMIIPKQLKKQIRSIIFKYAIILLKNNIITPDVIEKKYRNHIINNYNNDNDISNNDKSNSNVKTSTIIYYYNIKYLYRLLIKYTIMIKKMKNAIISLQYSVNCQILMYHKSKMIIESITELNSAQVRICILASDLFTKLGDLS
jgi:hypothetical protein